MTVIVWGEIRSLINNCEESSERSHSHTHSEREIYVHREPGTQRGRELYTNTTQLEHAYVRTNTHTHRHIHKEWSFHQASYNSIKISNSFDKVYLLYVAVITLELKAGSDRSPLFTDDVSALFINSPTKRGLSIQFIYLTMFYLGRTCAPS